MGSELVVIEINITVSVKETLLNIIKQGIIASAKDSFKQAIKD